MKSRQHLLFFLVIVLLTFSIATFPELRSLLIQHTKIDSWGHLIGFFLLMWILNSLVKLPLLNSAICVTFYAALSEVGQYYLGFRNGEFRDFIADVAGVLLFILFKWVSMVYGKKHLL
jgi:VanZ family protein